MTIPSIKFGQIPSNYRKDLCGTTASPNLTEMLANKLEGMGFQVGTPVLDQRKVVQKVTPNDAMTHLSEVAGLFRDNSVFVSDCDRHDNIKNQELNRNRLIALAAVLLERIPDRSLLSQLISKLDSLPFIISDDLCSEIRSRGRQLEK